MDNKGLGYVNGYLEKKPNGGYEGTIEVDGVNLSPIVGIYFKEESQHWLWLKRKATMDYDMQYGTYTKRTPKPFWECYLKKQASSSVAYKGYFIFCHFKYELTGIYDKYLKDVDRLNLFVERVQMSEQTIINNINKNKTFDHEK